MKIVVFQSTKLTIMKKILPVILVVILTSCMTTSTSTQSVKALKVNIIHEGVKIGSIIENGNNYSVVDQSGNEVLFLRKIVREVFAPQFTYGIEPESKLLHYYEFIFPKFQEKAELGIRDIRNRNGIKFLTNRQKRIHYIAEFIANSNILSFAGNNHERVSQFVFKYGNPYSILGSN